MYERQHESKSIECLTEYLQYFKSYFSVTLSLLEYHLFPQKSTNVQLDNIMQKILHKKHAINFTYSPFKIKIQQNNKSSIDRFYLRMVQFLEYRLLNFKKQDNQQSISKVINSFLASLNKTFKNINEHQASKVKNSSQHMTVGLVFIQLQSFVKRLVQAIFVHLQKINAKKSLNLEQIVFSKQMITQNLLTPFHQALTSFYQEERFQQEQKWNIRRKQTDDKTTENLCQSRSRSEINLNNLQSLNSKSLRQSKMVNEASYNQFRQKKMCINMSQIQKNLQIQGSNIKFHHKNAQQANKKQKYSKLIAIMDVQEIQVYSKDYLLGELINKNQKNHYIINKFLKLYHKKQKKYNRNKLKELYHGKLQDISREKGRQNQDDVEDQLAENKGLMQIKCKSELNISLSAQQVHKEREQTHKQKNNTHLNLIKKQKLSNPVAYVTGPATVVLKQQKATQMPKINPQSNSIRNQFIKPQSHELNPQFQSNKNIFMYKQKQKVYFQSIKNKLKVQFQKKSQFPSAEQQKHGSVSEKLKQNKQIEQPHDVDLKYTNSSKAHKSTRKQITIKGSNVINSNKIKSSSSQIYTKHQINDRNQTLETLEGSSLYKRVPAKGKMMKIWQYSKRKQESLMESLNKIPTDMSNSKLIKSQETVIILPKLPLLQKYYNDLK